VDPSQIAKRHEGVRSHGIYAGSYETNQIQCRIFGYYEPINFRVNYKYYE